MILTVNSEASPTAKKPRITVAICTFERPDDLATCLATLVEQSSDAGLFEVLVVDNGPHAATKAVAASFAATTGLKVRYATEPQRGTTYARRRAWIEAKGEIVAYVDDDAAVCPGWVASIADAFDGAEQNVAMVGGPVETVRGLPDPLVYTDHPGPGGLFLGPECRPLEDSEHLWGCNFAFRRAALETLDAHGESIGPKGNRPGANEDILIQRQLIQQGYKRLYVPGMQILHNTWRLTADARTLDRLAFWTGVDNAKMERYLDGLTLNERRAAIWRNLVRLRVQLPAAHRAWRQGGVGDPGWDGARRASLRTLGTISGQVWPLRLPGSKGWRDRPLTSRQD